MPDVELPIGTDLEQDTLVAAALRCWLAHEQTRDLPRQDPAAKPASTAIMLARAHRDHLALEDLGPPDELDQGVRARTEPGIDRVRVQPIASRHREHEQTRWGDDTFDVVKCRVAIGDVFEQIGAEDDIEASVDALQAGHVGHDIDARLCSRVEVDGRNSTAAERLEHVAVDVRLRHRAKLERRAADVEHRHPCAQPCAFEGRSDPQ
jgi:hypothetical protein